MKENKEFYVYKLIDSRNNETFYVGKGKKNRMKTHISRAKKWQQNNKSTFAVNKKLYNKILKIVNEGKEVICQKVETELTDEQACKLEKAIIAEIGLARLCNLSNGGESGKHSPETLEKIQKSLKAWRSSDDFRKFKERLSKERKGSGNPRFGHKEDPEKTKNRMKNCLSKPRWNKGLIGDPRAKGPAKGNIPHNAFYFHVLNLTNNEVTKGHIRDIVKTLNLPEVTVKRMIYKTYFSRKWSKIYKIRVEGNHNREDIWTDLYEWKDINS